MSKEERRETILCSGARKSEKLLGKMEGGGEAKTRRERERGEISAPSVRSLTHDSEEE